MQDYRRLFELSGKKAVVIGAASGIGKAAAEALGSLGAYVVCADTDLEGALQTASAISHDGLAEAEKINLASGTEIETLAAKIMEKHHRIDIAVTTPALNIRKLIMDYSEDEYDRVMNLNLKGTFNFFRSFGRLMMKQRAGSLIACSSMRAVTIEPGLGVYAASKGGITQLVKAFAAEMGPFNVRVNAVMPGIIETKLTAPLKEKAEIYRTYAAHTVLNRWGQPSEVGAAIAFLASEAASYISGSSLVVDGGWTAIDGPPTGLTSTRPSE
jgi:NAD(P)-dependent dehydrogenase (short-subunit alcohol dehydrogenase family)